MENTIPPPDSPWKFVSLIGTVSFLADFTYEGVRSLLGPFLRFLGASPLAVSALSGAGELIGYAMRLAGGWLADKTRKYWPIAFTGYVFNLLSGPALALCGTFNPAAALIVLERAGKGVRNPSRDAMLSFAAQKTGKPGTAFGLHDAMDKAGAVGGPLAAAYLFLRFSQYRIPFAALLIPAAAAFGVLIAVAKRYPKTENFAAELETGPLPSGAPGDSSSPKNFLPGKFSPAFWAATAACAFLACGTADFPFMAQRLEEHGRVSPTAIPALYAAAMAAGAAASFFFAHLSNRLKARALIAPAVIGAAAVPLVFLGGGFGTALAGSLLWGAGFASQEPVVKAFISERVPSFRRGTAFGVFWAVYGFSWFAGSVALGAVYQHSVPAMTVFSVTAQLLSLPFIALAFRLP